MVVFRATETHFTEIMRAMNCLRQEKTFCDISLTIEDKQVFAHKNVLAAGSPYFRTLFLGHFAEATMPDINLSSVTKDIVVLESIISFIYTGEINIDKNNLAVIVKLASFFLINQLRDFCGTFMLKTLDLSTCLKYYSNAVDHGFPEIEKKTASIVRARFHDCLIFQEETLSVLPNELMFLVGKGFLDYCSVPSVHCFLADWVNNGLTEEHASAATDILDYVNSRSPHSPLHQHEHSNLDVLSAFERVKNSLEKTNKDIGIKFIRRFKRIMCKCSSPSSPVHMPYNLRTLSPKSPAPENLSEDVVIAFSPRQCVIDAVEQRLSRGRFTTEISRYAEATFDICMYIPRTKSWYLLHPAYDLDVFGSILDEMTNGCWRYTCMWDRLCFILLGDETLYIYNLRDFSWKDINYSHLDDALAHNEVYFEVQNVISKDQKIYLVLKIKVCEDEDFDDVLQIFFRCYELKENDTWSLLFNTPKYDTDIDDGDTYISIGTVSNEMIIVHYNRQMVCAFVADLNETDPWATQIYPVGMVEETSVSNRRPSVHILEGKHQFFILVEDSNKVCLEYEYTYNSQKLLRTEGPSQQISDEDNFRESYPCNYQFSVSDRKSVWCFSGNKEDVSSLTETVVAKNKTVMVRSHTPPPFSCLVTAFAGKVSTECLTTLKPITKYLTPKDTVS